MEERRRLGRAAGVRVRRGARPVVPRQPRPPQGRHALRRRRHRRLPTPAWRRYTGSQIRRRRAAEGPGGPSRTGRSWREATSVSYDHLKRLNQHTDSSIPPHGVAALGLILHYAEGFGTNTLTDGFAVAEALKAEDPEGYALLAAYGYDGERDFVSSRVDSVQEFNRGLVVSTQAPLLQLDEGGRLKRIQYNEVFRMPLTMPYDVFPKWYAAFARFVELLHSEEYERKVPMEKGRFLLLHNWRPTRPRGRPPRPTASSWAAR